MLTGLLIGLLLAAGAGGIAAGTTAYGKAESAKRDRTIADYIKDWEAENGFELTDAQRKALITQYGDDEFRLFNSDTWGDQSDASGLKKALQDILDAHEKYGDMPEDLTPDELEQIQKDAYAEIDAENQKLLDLYNQSFANTSNMLQQQLAENTQMFNDYRNQMLTNSAMSQQAIAGAARFELDRQQRNAITRGASAAQRLVANINTQLGLQAQSAQQALDTSNALAQNLLAHRQAQQQVRESYINAQNQHNRDIASVTQGQAERRYGYGQARKEGAIADRDYAYDSWDRNISNNSGLGQVEQGIYRSRYGYNRRKSNSGL